MVSKSEILHKLQILKQQTIGVSVMVCITLFYSCSGTKHLKENEYLLRKNTITLKGESNLSVKNIMKEEVQTIIKQKPNSYFLNIPYRLHFYNFRYKTYQRDTTNFQIKSNFVEAPVIFDSTLLEQSIENIKGYLNNQGYFQPEVNAKTVYSKNKVKINYEIVSGISYAINNVTLQCPDSLAYKIIQASMEQTALKSQSNYSHLKVSEERVRIVNALRNWGYFNFGTNNITFELDTATQLNNQSKNAKNNIGSTKKREIDIEININDSRDKNAFLIHYFGKTIVYVDHDEAVPEDQYKSYTQNGITYKYLNDPYINFNIIDQKIITRLGTVFTQQAYNQTLKLLNELEIFQMVRVLINPSSDNNSKLTTTIYLSPNDKYDFNTNIEVSGGDLYTLGTALKLSIIDKNLFKGANRLTITGSYGIEANMHKNIPDLNFFQQFYLFSQNAGINFNLTFPKFMLPIKQDRWSRTMVPKSFLEGGINQLRRTDYFSLRSVNAGWGYRWRASTYEQWMIKPVFVNFLNLYNISPLFQGRMDSIPAIRNSYQEAFIEGEQLEYVYNSELKNPNKYQIFKIGIEESGLLMNGINALYQEINNTSERLRFAEYVRLDFDWRQYINSRKSSWAFRFYGGVGIPYNQATSLPYIKQYFVGGAYSIRGWRPRVLGPGSFNALEHANNTSYLFVDQAGDIKMEANAEYRFPILAMFGGAINLNGALFVDAGNIWLMKPSENMPGAEFKWNKLYQDIAASYGLGIRFDLGGFLVVRTDFAFQAKKPYVASNSGWTIQNSQFGNNQWRQENMNFNIAIGYPF